MRLLFYDYVEGILERRAPHREAHLAHVRAWKDDRRLLMAGAVGLVTARRVERWAVV
jgi:uncharacterized protein YciI